MPRYDPTKHHRRSIRLKGYDYSGAGAYFITATVRDRACILSEIHDSVVVLSALGEIVNRLWNDLPNRFLSVGLDAFVVMPNHIHGILILTDVVGATLAVARDGAADARNGAIIAQDRARASLAPTRPILGNVVGAFKSLCTIAWLDYIKQNDLNIVGKFWQRNMEPALSVAKGTHRPQRKGIEPHPRVHHVKSSALGIRSRESQRSTGKKRLACG
jgi:putative transposase